ncbi:MAG: cation-translocating P-type ATPase, partial [Holophagae bacterium]|nr:cation-translocating P-type ATPase [Holophagae bacterium]
VAELPFDSDRKRMTTVHAVRTPLPGLACLPGGESTHVAFTKGAVDGLLRLSSRVLGPDGIEPSTEAWQDRIVAAHDELAAKGLRVLGLTFRPLEGADTDPAHLEEDLVFVGMVGLLDPPRAEVREAVARCVSAGIRPIMITGDHPLTARRIAAELGIASAAPALTGRELDAMTGAELEAAAAETSVFARVSPEHKLRIVQALQNRGHVAAMTGDGVNDAPALKRANIGLAMGITGTDVAKEASDMVLLDDNFATIVAAVEEGRTIYDNLKRFVRFSVAGNLGKVLVMVLGPLLGKPLPLTPLQLLWLNLLTDGLLGLGLGVEPPERGVMRRPPYPPGEGVFARGGGRHTVWVGALIGAVALAVGAGYFFAGDPAWQTMVFTTLAFLQVAQALAVRSDRESILTLGLRSNLSLTVLAALTLGLQLLAVYAPPLRTFFGVEPLPLADLALAAGLAVGLLLVLETQKWLIRRKVHTTTSE